MSSRPRIIFNGVPPPDAGDLPTVEPGNRGGMGGTPPAPLSSGLTVPIPQDRIHHLYRVLRLTPGSQVELLDSVSGLGFQGEIQALDDRTGTVTVLEPLTSPGKGAGSTGNPELQLTLLVGTPKGSKLERIVRSITVLGATGIMPVITKRSTSRPMNPKRQANRLNRLEQIEKEARRLSGRAAPLQILPIAGSLGEAVGALDVSPHTPGPLKLVAYEGDDYLQWTDRQKPGSLPTPQIHGGPLPYLGNILRDYFEEFHRGQQVGGLAPWVILVIGPEGGLDGTEVAALVDQGFQPVSLGTRILPVEVAVEMAATVVVHQFRMGGY